MSQNVTTNIAAPDTSTNPMPENVDSGIMIANDLAQHEVDAREARIAEVAKIPKWVNKPTVADIQQAILQSAEMHDTHETKVQGWAVVLNPSGFGNAGDNSATKANPFVTSSRQQPKSNKSKVQPKLARKLLEWRATSLSEPLLADKDLYKTAPVTWEDTEAARQNGLILNSQLNTKMDRVRFTNEYVRRCVGRGTTIVFVNWLEETREVARAKPIYDIRAVDTSDKELLHKLGALIDMEESTPQDFYSSVPKQWQESVTQTLRTGRPHAPHLTGHEEVISTQQVKNHPDYTFVDTADYWVDPACKGYLNKARYQVRRFYTSVNELRNSGLYFNLDKVESTGVDTGASEAAAVSGTVDFSTEPTNLLSDQLGKRVAVFEYWGLWDINNDGVLQPVLASFVGNVMVRMENNPYPDQFAPFVVVPYIPIIDSPLGEPDVELIADNQAIIGATTRGVIDLMAKAVNGQTGMRQDALDPLNQQRFLLGKNYFFNPTMGDPSTNVYVHKFPEIPVSAGNLIAEQRGEAEEMTGVRPYAGPSNVKNNTRSQNQQKTPLDAAAKRETDILRRLVSGLEQLGRFSMAMNKEFLSDEEVVRITNEKFVAIRRDRLQGEVDISIEVVTPEEKGARASELAFMLQTMGPNAEPKKVNRILAEIAELRGMPALAHDFREMQPEPTEEEKQRMAMEQERHMLELELLKARIAVEHSRSGNYQSDSSLDMAKAGTEQAKARALNSSADLQDQDFVSKDGSNDQRAHETALQQAQSEGNINYAKVKHQLEQQGKDNDVQRDYAKNAIANMLQIK